MAATKVGDRFDDFRGDSFDDSHSARQLDELRTKDGCSLGMEVYDSNP